MATVKMPAGWEFTNRSQRFDRNGSFEVAYVNPHDAGVPAKKRPAPTFTLAKEAITLK